MLNYETLNETLLPAQPDANGLDADVGANAQGLDETISLVTSIKTLHHRGKNVRLDLGDEKEERLEDSASMDVSVPRKYDPALYLPSNHAASPVDQLKDSINKARERFSFALLARRAPYYLPILKWLPNYKWKEDFFYDFIAGLTCASLLIPQSLAYSLLAGLPPLSGMLTSFFANVIYAIFGSSPHLTVGAEATSAILLGQAIVDAVSLETDHPDYMNALSEAAGILTLMIGLITLVLGILRLGFIDSILSTPVLCGFVNAVAVVLVSEQLVNALGLPHCGTPGEDACNENASPFDNYIYAFKRLGKVNTATLVVTLCSLAFLFGMKFFKGWVVKHEARLAKEREERLAAQAAFAASEQVDDEDRPVQPVETKPPRSYAKLVQVIPDILILLLLGLIISSALDLEKKHHVVVLGSAAEQKGFINPFLPPITSSSTTDISSLLSAAFVIVIVGFAETMLIAKKMASESTPSYVVSPNRELIALGGASFISAFFGGICAYGSVTRSIVNKLSGARTQMTTIIVSFVLLFMLLFLMPLLKALPKAVPAAMIIVVACSLVETHELIFFWKLRDYNSLLLSALIFCLCVFIRIDLGILVGFVICVIACVKRTTEPSIVLLGRPERPANLSPSSSENDKEEPAFMRLADMDDAMMCQHIESVLLIKIEGSLFFANAAKTKESLHRLFHYGDLHVHPSEDKQPLTLKALILDCSALQNIDSSALNVLKEVCHEYHHPEPREMTGEAQLPPLHVLFVVRSFRHHLMHSFVKAGIVDVVGNHCFFEKQEDALQFVKELPSHEPALKYIEQPQQQQQQQPQAEDFVSSSSSSSSSSLEQQQSHHQQQQQQQQQLESPQSSANILNLDLEAQQQQQQQLSSPTNNIL